ncbi:MAG: ParB N-terminal domain-containing protein [Nitrososphaeria archaeon]|nr:ParB N-terminal domain-containing protein [Nitrososphaeria archaeon]
MKAWPKCEFTYLPLKKVYPNPFNANRMCYKEYESLKRDLLEKGVEGIPPILVTPRTDGFMIVDGEHRWRAALELGFETIRAEIVHLSDEDVKIECFKRNYQRGRIDYLKAGELFNIERNCGLTVREIAKKYNLSAYTVDYILQLTRLSAEVKEFIYKVNDSSEDYFENGFRFTFRHLIALSKLPEKDMLSFAKEFFEGNVSGPEAERIVANFLTKLRILSIIDEKVSGGLIFPKSAELLKSIVERDPLTFSEDRIERLCKICDESGQVNFIRSTFLENLDKSSLYSLAPLNGHELKNRKSSYFKCQCGRVYLVRGKILDILEKWDKPAEKIIEILPEHVGKRLRINYADMIAYFE